MSIDNKEQQIRELEPLHDGEAIPENSSQALEEQVRSDSWFDNDGYTLTRWPQGWRLIGGPRHRLFHRQDAQPLMMWKYPFFRMRPDTIVYDDHWLWPHDTVTSGALGALVHLKLLNSGPPEQDIEEGGIAFYEGSKRYRGPRSLLRHGMMMPIDWETGPDKTSSKVTADLENE